MANSPNTNKLTLQKAEELMKALDQLKASEAQRVETPGKSDSERTLRQSIANEVLPHASELLGAFFIAHRYHAVVRGVRILLDDTGIPAELKATFASFLAAPIPDTTGVVDSENKGK